MKKSLIALTGVFMPHNDTITQITYKHLCNLDYNIDVLSFKSEKDVSMEKALTKDKNYSKFSIYYLNDDWKKVYVGKNNLNVFKILKNINSYYNKSLSMIKDKEYDILYSSSVPNYTHYASYLIKRKLGNKIKWYASFSDPIIDNPYVDGMKRKNIFTKDMVAYFLQKNIHYRKKFQNKAFKYADKLIFISEELRDYMTKGDKKLLSKSIVIPITYIKEWPMYKALLKKPILTNNKKIKFIHFGNIYGLRKINLFLVALKELKKEIPNLNKIIEIHQYGNIEYNQAKLIDIYDIKDIFKLHDRVNYEKCLSLMKNDADVLLIFDTILESNKIQPFLPSKTMEYLLTGKPILSITTKNSPVYRLLSDKYNCSLYSVDDIKNTIKKQIANIDVINYNYEKYENYNVILNTLGKELNICKK